MDDETQVVPVDGSEAQPESTQTTEAQVTPEPQAAPALSLEQVERLLSEREAKLRAEFEQQSRKAQSKTDKAYADALRKAKVIEESAELLGLDADSIKAAKQALIDKEFTAAFDETPANAQTAPMPASPSPAPSYSPTVSREELEAILRENGLEANAVDLMKYAGRPRSDAELAQEWQDDVILAKAKQAELRQQQKQNRARAKEAGQVKQQYGGLAAPASGTPSAGYDPIKELEKLNAQPIPTDPVAYTAYKARREKLYEEATRKGWS